MKKLIRNLLPFGVVQYLRKRKDRATASEKRIKTRDREYSYNNAIQYLTSLGISSHEIRSGSIPIDSLKEIEKLIQKENIKSHEKPYTVLHIGNFVGVSLVEILSYLRGSSLKYHVVAIDPNITHRGIENPQNAVCKLLSEYGLNTNLLLCCGYTLRKSVGDDGYRMDNGLSPHGRLENEAAPIEVLKTLQNSYSNRFNMVIIDGNHEGDYLAAELTEINKLMATDGILVLDDVSSDWPEVSKVAKNLVKSNWNLLTANGRIAVFKQVSNKFNKH